MPAAPLETVSIEQQALNALDYLSEEDKSKVLKYIESLIQIDAPSNDKTSAI
jgi:hypothetical protein